MTRRVLAAAAFGYVAMGVAGLALERAGVVRCQCGPTCWCKRRTVSLFRWILPVGHDGAGSDTQ